MHYMNTHYSTYALTGPHAKFPYLSAIYFSKMDIEQTVKDLQAQNLQFQQLLTTLAKGQEDLKAMLEKEKEK